MNKYTGSCLCGTISYEVEGEFENFFLCHCDYCRKDTGSAHAANLFSRHASLKWLSGEDKVNHFDLPDTQHSKSFCSICGSAVPRLKMDGKLLVVPAGSLDTQVALKPDAHLFVSSKASWDNELEKLPQFAKYPEK